MRSSMCTPDFSQNRSLESKRMERHLRMEEQIVKTLDNDVWKAEYDTNFSIFFISVTEVLMSFKETQVKPVLKNKPSLRIQ